MGRAILPAAGFRPALPAWTRIFNPSLNTAASPPNSPADRIRTPTPRARRLAPPRIRLVLYRPKQSVCSVRIRRYTCLTGIRSCGLPRPTPPPLDPAFGPHQSLRTNSPHTSNSADGQTPCVPAAYPPNSALPRPAGRTTRAAQLSSAPAPRCVPPASRGKVKLARPPPFVSYRSAAIARCPFPQGGSEAPPHVAYILLDARRC